MALIKCKECKSKISDQAAACPKCGAPVTVTVTKGVPKEKSSIGWGFFLWLYICALINFALIRLTLNSSSGFVAYDLLIAIGLTVLIRYIYKKKKLDEQLKAQPKLRATLAVLLFIAPSLILMTQLPPSAQSTQSTPQSNDSTMIMITARDTAKEAVRQSLKSPSTAQFSENFLDADDYKYYQSKDGKTMTVESFVDAQNAFGATLRKRWQVKLKRNGTEDGTPRWIVQKVIIE